MNIAREVGSPTARMNLPAELVTAAHKKHDENLSIEVLNEARRTPAESVAKGLHASGLFPLAADTAYFASTEAMLMLQDGIVEVNSLNSSANGNARDGILALGRKNLLARKREGATPIST